MSSDEQQAGSIAPQNAGVERVDAGRTSAEALDDAAAGTGTSGAESARTDLASAEPVEPEAEVPAQLPAQLPGELLAARRAELNLSIDAVSTRLRLAPRQIAALEANDFAALPGMAIVRGFVRSYAKLLGLDPQPLVAMLKAEPNPVFDPVASRQPLPASGFRARRYAPPVLHRAGASRLAGFAALVLVFVGTLAFIAYRNDWLQLPSLPSLPSASDKPAAAVPASPPAQPAASEQPPAGAPQAAGALELKAREDSWVEVVAVSGERKLLSKLMKAGSTELVEISEPVMLLIGNAVGVDAILRGEPLNLKAAARDNVVKLSLN